jgi:hypothetical protein
MAQGISIFLHVCLYFFWCFFWCFFFFFSHVKAHLSRSSSVYPLCSIYRPSPMVDSAHCRS